MQTCLNSYIQAAIRGSEIYYRYLTDHQRGLVEYDVEKITHKGKYFILTLRSALKNPEMIQVRIENKIYTLEEIKPIEYSEKTKQLTVRPLDTLSLELGDASPNDVTVISDLRFLVKRIEHWYRSYGKKISLPNRCPAIAGPDSHALKTQPSEEQKDAIHAALSHPFSYIWGAPGTGKTQFVLARCILAYVQAKQRIWITAPTNNAVEQMLYGVLPVLEEAGIPLENVLRMGMASRAFRSRYPSVCEDASAARISAAIDEEILKIEAALSDIQQQINRLTAYKNFLSFEQAQNHWEQKMPVRLEQIKASHEELRTLESECTQLQGRIYLAQSEQETLESQKEKHAAAVCNLTRQVEQYRSGWRKWFFFGRREKLMQMLQHEMQQLDNTQEALNHAVESQKSYAQQERELQQKQCACSETLLLYKNDLCELAAYWKPLMQAAEQLRERTTDADFLYLHAQTQRARDKLEERRPRYADCSEMSMDKLLESESELEQQRANCLIRKQNTEQDKSCIRIQDRLVLAATVDSCLYRMPPNGDLKPVHIFLDEAGYCALIKGTALLAYDCPVTFLGDHMQLSPVCEMPDSIMSEDREPSTCLWAQSSLYAEDVFTQTLEQIAKGYRLHLPAQFTKLKRFDLTHTYRFGKKLARVLADSVYSSAFWGNPEHDTDVYFIHAEKLPESEKNRTSQTERDAIAAYIRTHPKEQIGIITPYKNQRDSIRKALSRIDGADDLVLTVHGSQGREWDTVLFSVVDTSDKWFTDSDRLESNGKRVINTESGVGDADKKLDSKRRQLNVYKRAGRNRAKRIRAAGVNSCCNPSVGIPQ